MRDPGLILPACGAAILILGLLTGCRSAWIQTVVTNQESTPVNLVEVDYAGGSFGVQTIAPHASFHYRFHLLGSDKVKMEFTDSSYKNLKVTGPELQKGQAGTLRIEIEPGDKVEWLPALKMIRQ